jgi:hypothetical protein
MDNNGIELLCSIKNKFYTDYLDDNIRIRVEVPGVWTSELNMDQAMEYCKSQEGDIIHLIIRVEELKGRVWVTYDCDELSSALNSVTDLRDRLTLIRQYRSAK